MELAVKTCTPSGVPCRTIIRLRNQIHDVLLPTSQP